MNQDESAAYSEGYNAQKKGKPESANPYEEGGHERNTSWSNNMYYHWYKGWNDAADGEPSEVAH